MTRLPEDIIGEILARILKVKSLFRFKCVSKSWCSLISLLISTEKHIKSHRQKSIKNAVPYSDGDLISIESIRDLELNPRKYENSDVELFVTTNKDLENTETIIAAKLYLKKYPHTSKGRSDNSWFVGCSNGLSCLYIDEEIYLWNPCTRKLYMLPDPSFSESGCQLESDWFSYYPIKSTGFGYDEFNDDYKVLVQYVGYNNVDDKNLNLVMVYNLKTNCWRVVWKFYDCRYRVEDPEIKFVTAELDKSGKLLHGKLHWGSLDEDSWRIEDDVWAIVSFDLSSHVYEILEKPSYEVNNFCLSYSLEVVKECICTNIFCDKERWSDFWIMGDYGVKESWYKSFRFYHDIEIPNYPRFDPVCMTEELEILGEHEETFMFYNPATNTIRHPKISNSGELHKGDIRIQSLVSPFPKKMQEAW